RERLADLIAVAAEPAVEDGDLDAVPAQPGFVPGPSAEEIEVVGPLLRQPLVAVLRPRRDGIAGRRAERTHQNDREGKDSGAHETAVWSIGLIRTIRGRIMHCSAPTVDL